MAQLFFIVVAVCPNLYSKTKGQNSYSEFAMDL